MTFGTVALALNQMGSQSGIIPRALQPIQLENGDLALLENGDNILKE